MAGLVLDTPAKHIYTGDGTTRVYPIPTYIQGDDWIRIEIDGIYIVDRRSYDIVNNSIIFVTAPGLNTQVSVQVATSVEALSQLGNSTNVDTVAGSIGNVNTVATNINNVNIVSNDINNVNNVGTNINNVNIVANDINSVKTTATNINNVNTTAGSIVNVNTVAGNISKVNTVATNIVDINQIVDNLPEILLADDNATTATQQATIATTKASEASASANQALTSRNQAETFKNSASTSATTATTKASEASASASTATTKASEASASATSASTSANQALTSRNQAETFAQQAQASASSVDANNIVHRIGDESIDGIKTFIKSPIVPTPTTGTQAVNKDYVDSKPTLSIGAILNGYTIFSNCIVAFGGEFNRVDYPKLWAYLQANPTLVKTQAEWTTENTTNGMCGYYSSGNGTTTFRVPNLDKAFLRPDSRSVASFQEGSYATGDFNSTTPTTVSLLNYDDDIGAFRSRMNWDGITTVSIGATNLRFVASTRSDSGTYQSQPTIFGVTRPKNIAVLPLIVAK